MLQKLIFRKPEPQPEMVDVVALIEKAYRQGWWDKARANNDRFEVSTCEQGIARFMAREADALRE